MHAERFITRTDREGRLSGLPALPAGEEVEVIVLRKETPVSHSPGSRELEEAYREAGAEIDPAWEITAGDGLGDEAW